MIQVITMEMQRVACVSPAYVRLGNEIGRRTSSRPLITIYPLRLKRFRRAERAVKREGGGIPFQVKHERARLNTAPAKIKDIILGL